MYVCTYVCMYVCTYVRTYVCMYVMMYQQGLRYIVSQLWHTLSLKARTISKNLYVDNHYNCESGVAVLYSFQ